MKELNKQKGITLIALITTIIILLILVGITINGLTSSGLFENAKLAKEKYQIEQELELNKLDNYENLIGDIDGSRNLSLMNVTLDYDNKIDIASYNSKDNKFITPSNGIIIVTSTMTANAKIRIYLY